MSKYFWTTDKDINDVISCMTKLTDTPNIIERNLYNYKRLNYRRLGSDEYLFSLWFHYGLWNKISYMPAPVSGTIKSTAKGCRIEAQRRVWIAIVNTVSFILLNAVEYIAAIAAPITGFKGAMGISIIFGIIAIGSSARFIYTLKKWKSANDLIHIIDLATSAERQQF